MKTFHIDLLFFQLSILESQISELLRNKILRFGFNQADDSFQAVPLDTIYFYPDETRPFCQEC